MPGYSTASQSTIVHSDAEHILIHRMGSMSRSHSGMRCRHRDSAGRILPLLVRMGFRHTAGSSRRTTWRTMREWIPGAKGVGASFGSRQQRIEGTLDGRAAMQ